MLEFGEKLSMTMNDNSSKVIWKLWFFIFLLFVLVFDVLIFNTVLSYYFEYLVALPDKKKKTLSKNQKDKNNW